MLCMFLAALENVDAFPMWIWLIFIKWFWRRWFWRISTEFYIFVGTVKIVFYHIFLNLWMVLLRWKKLNMWFKMQRTFLFLLLRKDKVLQKLVDNNSYLTCTEVTLHQIDLNFNLFYCVFQTVCDKRGVDLTEKESTCQQVNHKMHFIFYSVWPDDQRLWQ